MVVLYMRPLDAIRCGSTYGVEAVVVVVVVVEEENGRTQMINLWSISARRECSPR